MILNVVLDLVIWESLLQLKTLTIASVVFSLAAYLRYLDDL